MRPDRRAANDRPRENAKPTPRRAFSTAASIAGRLVRPVPGGRDTAPNRDERIFFFDVVDALAARDAAAPRARQSQPHASHAASHAAPLPMSLVAESRRHLARWATRAAVRPMAIIPESHQVKEKKDAPRVDFFGDQQAIDSRCVRTRRASQSTVNDVPRRHAREDVPGDPARTDLTSRRRPPSRDDAKSDPRTTTNPRVS